MNNERETWLASLKEGDEVAVHHNRGYTITTITRITPTRIIKTADGNAFKNGQMKGATTWDCDKYLKPITQDILDWRRRKELAYKVSTVNASKLSLDQLECINAILEEANNRD